MQRLNHLPADALEPALPHQAVLARRMGGTGGWRWFPLALRALDDIAIESTAPFWVVFSETQAVAGAVSRWAAKQIVSPLHITPAPWDGAITGDELNTEAIRYHIETTLHAVRRQNASLDGDLIDHALAAWLGRPHVQAGFSKREHNCTLPNHMTLEAAGTTFSDAVPLIGNATEDYVTAIVETSEAVRGLRRDVGQVPAFRLTPPHPSVIITAPALFRHVYQSTRVAVGSSTADPQIVNKVMRFLQRQASFQWMLKKEELDRLLASEDARSVIQTREEELEVHTLAVGLRSASTLAATIRVPPAVNRTAGVVRQLAMHARADGIRRPQKFAKLFSAVQSALRDAVGPDLLRLIERNEGGIKLITDAPLEWLPVGDLTLGLKFDTSRITATPGNLMAGALALPPLMRLKTTASSDVLLLSAFDAEDPIRQMIPDALEAASPMWRDKFTIRSTEVQDEATFCAALNSYDGGVLIFDGHGHHSDESGVGTLAIGANNIDVWSLRGRVRVPPVVILSACDTHAADRSHATTANAFMALGARTVLSTLLPIDARRAAIFVGRLLYRLADFVPAALAVRGQAILWSEIVGGMLRMQLLTDLLRPYLAKNVLNRGAYAFIHEAGNVAINTCRPDWFELVVGMVVERSSLSPNQVLNQFRSHLPFSDTIRYIQIGNPETVLIDDALTMQRVKADLAHRERAE
ncbi:MAG: CHAT domain-containing protein [Aestuariivirga sp.]